MVYIGSYNNEELNNCVAVRNMMIWSSQKYTDPECLDNRDGYPGENRGQYDMDIFTPEKPDISGFWIHHIISISSGIYGDI